MKIDIDRLEVGDKVQCGTVIDIAKNDNETLVLIEDFSDQWVIKVDQNGNIILEDDNV